jgi:FlaA1/EpsC-like NDP-sugar epimerase
LINQLLSLSKNNKRLVLLLVDSVLIVSILLASFSIRLGFWYFPDNGLILVIFGAPIIAIPVFAGFGLYRAVIRYIGLKTLWTVVHAVSLYALLWGIAGLMMSVEGIPRSVILINWMVSLLAIGGVRVFARFLLSNNVRFKSNNINYTSQSKVLVYGAGEAGVQLISALEHSGEFLPVGFIDDSKELQGRHISGLNIYSIDSIDKVINKFKVDEVLIAMPSVSRTIQLSIINKLEAYPVLVRILPGVSELAQGKINVSDLREISIKDLLGRASIDANKELLCKNISNKTVVVTGAGGSIGSELCRQIVLLKPKALILYEINELVLYSIEKELSNIGMSLMDIYPILGSVNNKNRLRSVFKRFDVDTIYHAAAYKHVPMVEFNNTEGVDNNIFGTLNCAQAAIDAGVETFVLISTDKAVRPTNTMGATKRGAELILQALSAKQSGTRFSVVRFGNVLGSSGSVIPLFKQQIRAGGPVTVTDKDIIRYFMTLDEAVELVIQAGAMGEGGEVFVLDMGKPVRIQDLAEKMIRLSGLEVKDESCPDGDIEIKYIGLRSGEKLYEELLIGDNVSKTDNPLIMCAQEDMLLWDELKPVLDELSDALDSSDHERLRKLLIRIVPGFKPQSEISDILYNDK